MEPSSTHTEVTTLDVYAEGAFVGLRGYIVPLFLALLYEWMKCDQARKWSSAWEFSSLSRPSGTQLIV